MRLTVLIETSWTIQKSEINCWTKTNEHRYRIGVSCSKRGTSQLNKVARKEILIMQRTCMHACLSAKYARAHFFRKKERLTANELRFELNRNIIDFHRAQRTFFTEERHLKVGWPGAGIERIPMRTSEISSCKMRSALSTKMVHEDAWWKFLADTDTPRQNVKSWGQHGDTRSELKERSRRRRRTDPR